MFLNVYLVVAIATALFTIYVSYTDWARGVNVTMENFWMLVIGFIPIFNIAYLAILLYVAFSELNSPQFKFLFNKNSVIFNGKQK